MSSEEKEDFQIDIRLVDKKMMLARSTYGLRRFFMKEDVLGPESNYVQVMCKVAPAATGYIQSSMDFTQLLRS